MAVFAVGVGVLDWQRRGVGVAVVAVSLWLASIAALGVLRKCQREESPPRALRFGLGALLFASGYWAISVGIQRQPLAEEAVIAGLLGTFWAAWLGRMSSRLVP